MFRAICDKLAPIRHITLSKSSSITVCQIPAFQIGIVYSKSSELRAMFLETLSRVTQACLSQHPTLKLMPSLPNLKDKALGKANKYSATEDEKLQKTLLLCIVRLIHAGTLSGLYNQDIFKPHLNRDEIKFNLSVPGI